MSRNAGPRARFVALLLVLALGGIGCWEQWSNDWFPQMKWQPAVQAYERVMHDDKVDLLEPPEGTVPVGGGEAPVDPMVAAEGDQLVNPRPMSLESLENGRALYQTYCETCHGAGGMGDGPVSSTGSIQGPFAGVLPLAIAAGRSDGHVYTTIRYGRRRMPAYGRIPSEDRWDIVNYVRYLNKQRGIQ